MVGIPDLSLASESMTHLHLPAFHVVTDLATAFTYFLVPSAVVKIVRARREIEHKWIYLCFAGYIALCGIMRVAAAATSEPHSLWLATALRIGTTVIALTTLVLLWRLAPFILAMPARADIERSNQQLAAVLDNTAVCVYAVDSEWTITYMNDNAKHVLSPMGNILGKSLLEAFPQQREDTRARLRSAMISRQQDTFESYFEPLDLSTIVSLHPLQEGGITIFFNDISHQRRLERDLERERDLRSHRIEVLARLSAELAHEIKNPLAIIHARASDLAEMADEGDVGRAEITKTCASILSTSDRAIKILRGVEAMARGGAHDPMQRASIAEIVREAMQLVQGRFRLNGILLDAVVPAGLPMLECRVVQISQVLVNLLNNAFDAVNGGSQSQRWARIVVSMKSSVLRSDPLDRVEISVIDGGPGVALEDRTRLMETFFTTKALGAGLGIGLSVSRAIAEQHGGRLELRDSEGNTCFQLTLPVKAKSLDGVAA